MEQFISQALELAKNITSFLGEGEAANIISMVKDFITKIDFSVITDLLGKIIGMFG